MIMQHPSRPNLILTDAPHNDTAFLNRITTAVKGRTDTFYAPDG